MFWPLHTGSRSLGQTHSPLFSRRAIRKTLWDDEYTLNQQRTLILAECCYQSSELYEEAFIEENLDTLRLLLPEHDKDTKSWFRNQLQQYHLDPAANQNSHLSTVSRQIELFRYWRDRLVILKQVFDDSEPQTIKQW